MIFLVNGVCMGEAFRPLYAGRYYPTISLYRGAQVEARFEGLQFLDRAQHALDSMLAVQSAQGGQPIHRSAPSSPAHVGRVRPLSDAVADAEIQQTLADLLYLVDRFPQDH